MRKHGFTLAELLIALTVLAVIVGFAIPKVLNQMAEQEMKANFKETFGALSAILREGAVQGTIQSQQQFRSALIGKFQYVRYCGVSSTSGCWVTGQVNDDISTSGFILSNGSMLWGFNSSIGSSTDHFWIDLNGINPPNQEGNDSIRLRACFTDVDSRCQNGGSGGYAGQRGSGLIHPEGTASVAMFNSLNVQ
jgi:prepilin-type N-terminal cleavage/methylation domain-containing protein